MRRGDEHLNKAASLGRVPLSAEVQFRLIAAPVLAELLRLGFSLETVGLILFDADR